LHQTHKKNRDAHTKGGKIGYVGPNQGHLTRSLYNTPNMIIVIQII